VSTWRKFARATSGIELLPRVESIKRMSKNSATGCQPTKGSRSNALSPYKRRHVLTSVPRSAATIWPGHAHRVSSVRDPPVVLNVQARGRCDDESAPG